MQAAMHQRRWTFRTARKASDVAGAQLGQSFHVCLHDMYVAHHRSAATKSCLAVKRQRSLERPLDFEESDSLCHGGMQTPHQVFIFFWIPCNPILLVSWDPIFHPKVFVSVSSSREGMSRFMRVLLLEAAQNL
jgi:hypothetical protein